MKKGDRIKVQSADRQEWVPGTVVLISDNQVSVGVQMDHYFSLPCGSGRVMLDTMGLLYNGQQYVELFSGAVVKVEPL